MSQWLKIRKQIRDYPETEQQRKVKVAGKVVGLVCKGKKGQEFRSCRTEVLGCIVKKDGAKCSVEIQHTKEEVEEKLREQ
jgi:hypothetical protein